MYSLRLRWDPSASPQDDGALPQDDFRDPWRWRLPLLFLSLIVACGTAPVEKEKKLPQFISGDFVEGSYDVVWKALETAMQDYPIVESDPSEGYLETGWIGGRSKTHYAPYKGRYESPKRLPLSSRFRFFVDLEKKVGGVQINIESEEQIQLLDNEGKSTGRWKQIEPDTRHHKELIAAIREALSQQSKAE